MPNRHYPPAYLRYLRARLWNLGRPGFWVTAIFLSVVGLVTWEYWSNPDIFVYKQKKQVASQKPADSSLSNENKAIAADIDNLPVLFNDFDQATLSLTANTPNEKTEVKKSKGLLEDLINKQKSGNDSKLKSGLGIVKPESPPTLKNPFIAQTENLLRTGTVDSNSQFLGLNSLNGASETEGEQASSSLGIGLTNQTNKNQNSVSISPLQAALNESTDQKLSGFNGINTTGPNALGRVSDTGTRLMPPMNSLPNQNSLPTTGLIPGTGYTSTGTNLQLNPYSNLNSGQSPVAPPVNSVAPTNITPYSSQSPNQSVITPTTSAGYGNYGLQQPTQVPQSTYGNYGLQQPTQVPQPTYGNYGLQQPTQVPQSTYGNYGSQQPTESPNSTAAYMRQILEKHRGQNQR
ncbi:hypothetical protein IQ276_007975 [Desmonostoc muscorum LEGE 12446]|uniref:Uncharacterized protein n=1 Tax=Desmonostoc muscorum LEGE 12446 TaxID=1828758 RepID=A0A8J7DIS3_DESMC|nr:hypothetical protein [Desmonostoc muscorum]MCF2146387.1 hypothetical protein [Desmonostoc muscorum LEGE 12446]